MLVLGLLCVALACVAMFLYWFRGWDEGYYFIGVMIMFGVAIAMGLRTSHLISGYMLNVPVRVFDKGISYRPMPYTHDVFVKWVDIIEVFSTQSATQGYLYTFLVRWGHRVSIRRAGEGVDELIPKVEQRLRDASNDEPDFESGSYGMQRFRLIKFVSYGVAFVVASFTSFYLAYWLIPNNGTLGPESYFMLAAMVFPAIFMPVFTLVGLRLVFQARTMGLPKGMDFPVIIAFGVAALMVMGGGFAAAMLLPPTATDIMKDGRPSDSWLLGDVYTDQALTVDGNIVVDAGQTVRFVNCDITMAADEAGELSIWVAEGGRLEMVDTTLTSDHERGYKFEVHGSALIQRCNISRVWGVDTRLNGDGGLEIYSSNVTISDSRVSDCAVNGLLIYDCAPTIVNTTITEIGDDGIELQRGDPTIDGCIFYRCMWAITIFDGSNPVIVNNVFLDNDYGVAFENSNPTIYNNTFTETSSIAVSYMGDSDPVIGNNTYSDNGVDVEDQSELEAAGGLFICLPAGLAAVIASTAALIAMERLIVRRPYQESNREQFQKREENAIRIHIEKKKRKKKGR